MKTSTDDFQERQLKLQRFRQLAAQHAGLVIASQLAQLTAETRNSTNPSERKELLKGSRRAHPHKR